MYFSKIEGRFADRNVFTRFVKRVGVLNARIFLDFYRLSSFQNDNFLNGTKTILELNHFSQKEAVCFIDNDCLYIADERTKKVGGNVYSVSLKKLKSKS